MINPLPSDQNTPDPEKPDVDGAGTGLPAVDASEIKRSKLNFKPRKPTPSTQKPARKAAQAQQNNVAPPEPAVQHDYAIGENVQGKGIYFGVYTLTGPLNGLTKTFNMFASAKDLNRRKLINPADRFLDKWKLSAEIYDQVYNNNLFIYSEALAALKQFNKKIFGREMASYKDAISLELDLMMDAYDGGYIIPSIEMLAGTGTGSSNAGNTEGLLRYKLAGEIKGTIDTDFFKDKDYWSSTRPQEAGDERYTGSTAPAANLPQGFIVVPRKRSCESDYCAVRPVRLELKP